MSDSLENADVSSDIDSSLQHECDTQVTETLEPRDQLSTMLQKETIEELYKFLKGKKHMADPCLLTPDVFVDVLEDRENIEREKAVRLYEKIDWTSMKEVTWSEFCTFMMTEFGIQDSRERKGKEVEFITPHRLAEIPHREPSVHIENTFDGFWVTVSEEATITMWSASGKLKRHKICPRRGRYKASEGEEVGTALTMLAQVPNASLHNDQKSATRMKTKHGKQWVIASQLMTEFGKIIVATGRREIQFYDILSFNPFCQISGLESLPLCLDYKCICTDKCLLLYGDEMGCVGVLTFNCIGKSFRSWKKLHKHEDFIPSMPIDQAIQEKDISFMRWQVHNSWVLKVRYNIDSDHIISCSRNPHSSLVIGHRRPSTNIAKLKGADVTKGKRGTLYACTRHRYPQDQTVFSLGCGVKCFDFCFKLSLVATGGIDHIIRLWNCFLNKEPIATLLGHYDVIEFLQLSHPHDRLFSVSKDRWVKVWHIRDYSCLMTVPAHTHRLTGQLRSICINSVTNSLAMLGDNLAILRLKQETELFDPTSHKHPVTCVLYNPVFNHVISACEGSTVKTWNLDTGILEGEFVEAHETHGVSDMALDGTGKKLITVSRNGSGKIWNYNTSMCVRILQPENEHEVPLTAVTYADMHNVKYILTAGWGHRLNRYIDDTPQNIPFQMPMLPHWKDDLKRGHVADVLCCDYSERHQAASGGFDGVVTVWNLDTGYRFAKIVPSKPEGWSEEKLQADLGVNCVHFLRLRSKQRKGGNLVVGGPYGYVSMWSTNFANQITEAVASFPVSSDPCPGDDVISVTAMDSDAQNQILATGDGRGRISLWGIAEYALYTKEKHPPRRVKSWMAHSHGISSIQLAKEGCFVVSSANRSVRMWTVTGLYIGTFGQNDVWNVQDETTYMYPRVPRDIREFYSYVGEYEQEKTEETVEPSESYMKGRRTDHYDTGLKYFARQKAVLSKRGRHLNDEFDYRVFSASGSVAPYQALRHYTMQLPPDVPQKDPLLERLYDVDDLHIPELDDYLKRN